METYIGLKRDQFELVLNSVYQSLFQVYKNKKNAEIALYIYLMKLRTNHTNQQIAPLFNVNDRTVSSRIRMVRDILFEQFVPLHLNNYSRDELIKYTTHLSRELYEVGNDTAIVTFDGTYIYTIISSNYGFQKKSYSTQKKRNLVKFMMCVSTNGRIFGVYGPYEARKNDAAILREIMNEPGSIFHELRAGDVVVVDRGFRDCRRELQNRNLVVKMPAFVPRNSNRQLTRVQANNSRFVTKTRYVVEVRNGHIKNRWQYFKAVKAHQSIPYLKKDFQIAAALVNAFCSEIVCDRRDWQHMVNLMAVGNNNNTNLIQRLDRQIPQRLFVEVINLTLFPKLTYEQLKEISQGTYQINQARSYCQMHMAANNNNFPIKMCSQAQCPFVELLTPNSLLLLVNFPSRFKSQKKHRTYVFLEKNGNGDYQIRAYRCTCKNGLRTVGCCSHTMALIWYTLHIDHTQLHLPSQQLNSVF